MWYLLITINSLLLRKIRLSYQVSVWERPSTFWLVQMTRDTDARIIPWKMESAKGSSSVALCCSSTCMQSKFITFNDSEKSKESNILHQVKICIKCKYQCWYVKGVVEQVIPLHSYVICSYFHATTLELSSYNKDHMTFKV